ncbi:FAD-dependent oxidoreductase, partial [Acinetobacter baumannii]|uniref:FAD-dependent oxidoreductase n=1 Tax=Acinetobacter baumannii TaxID=470 RepID=UPI003EDA31C7
VELAGIFVQIGLLPNTDFLKDSEVELTNRGEIIVNDRNETNVKGVFAAGDCTTVPYKQIIIATGEGAKASLSAFDYNTALACFLDPLAARIGPGVGDGHHLQAGFLPVEGDAVGVVVVGGQHQFLARCHALAPFVGGNRAGEHVAGQVVVAVA